MRRIIKRGLVLICGALAAAAVTGILSGCGVKYDENEIKSEAAALIEKSYEINNICFGNGLPADFSKTENGGEYVAGSLVYAYVDEISPYNSVAELKTAIGEIYSAAYSEQLFTMLFSGLSVSVGDGDQKQSVAYARYIDGDEGLRALLMNPDDILSLERSYATDKITVVSQKSGRVEISAPSYINGEYDRDVILTMVLEGDSWKLDTPTY